jgi:DNA polymerase family A
MIRPDALECFGPLTEAIQVKGAIALAMITHNGMHLDLARLDKVRTGLRQQVDALVVLLRADHTWADVLNCDRAGQVVLTAKGQTPSLKQNRLRELLQDVAAEVSGEGGACIRVPRTAKGQVSLRAEDWEELARYHPLVQTWLELVKATKALQFFGNLTDPVIHPRYEPLVRTGRTSCTSPNVQNLPREGGFREAFVASPGHVFLVADYSFIELRTLAAECEARYGESRLADVIRAGVDPHCHTAAMFEGLALDEFMALKASKNPLERELYATLRQRAKVVNFGIPGGLGPATLVASVVPRSAGPPEGGCR